MPNETSQEALITETLVEPLGDILKHVGLAISETQMALDRNSIAIETELADKREEIGYDLHATWYHLPETTVELKMSLSMHWEEKKKGVKTVAWKKIMTAAPINASYNNLFNYDVTGASTIKAKIVSIPPTNTLSRE
jgi:hypothetical protein